MFNAKRQDSFTPRKFVQLLLIALQVNLVNAFCKICKLTQCVGKTTASPYWDETIFEGSFSFLRIAFSRDFQIIAKLVFYIIL